MARKSLRNSDQQKYFYVTCIGLRYSQKGQSWQDLISWLKWQSLHLRDCLWFYDKKMELEDRIQIAVLALSLMDSLFLGNFLNLSEFLLPQEQVIVRLNQRVITGYARQLLTKVRKTYFTIPLVYSHCYLLFSNPNANQERLCFACTFDRTILNYEQIMFLGTLPYPLAS